MNGEEKGKQSVQIMTTASTVPQLPASDAAGGMERAGKRREERGETEGAVVVALPTNTTRKEREKETMPKTIKYNQEREIEYSTEKYKKLRCCYCCVCVLAIRRMLKVAVKQQK